MKAPIDNTIIIAGDFNTPPSLTNSAPRQMVNKKTDLNNTINQLDISEIYKTVNPMATECTLFSNIHGT